MPSHGVRLNCNTDFTKRVTMGTVLNDIPNDIFPWITGLVYGKIYQEGKERDTL